LLNEENLVESFVMFINEEDKVKKSIDCYDVRPCFALTVRGCGMMDFKYNEDRSGFQVIKM